MSQTSAHPACAQDNRFTRVEAAKAADRVFAIVIEQP
jgi:hypothetical protein